MPNKPLCHLTPPTPYPVNLSCKASHSQNVHRSQKTSKSKQSGASCPSHSVCFLLTVAANEEFTAGQQEPQNGGPVTNTVEEVSVGKPIPYPVPTVNGVGESNPEPSDVDIAPEKTDLLQELSGYITQDESLLGRGEATILEPSDSGPQSYEKPPMLLLTSPSPLPVTEDELQHTHEHVAGPADIDAPLSMEESLLQQDGNIQNTPPLSSTPISSNAAGRPEAAATPVTSTDAETPPQGVGTTVSPPPYETLLSPTGTPETAV